MSAEVVKRLMGSFDDLGRSIAVAKQELLQQDKSPFGILARLTSYEEILGKQRKLAESMYRNIQAGEMDEAARSMKLINGLSAMVSDDAMEVAVKIADSYANR